jgi:GWxTD domain-containing protein
MDRGSGIRKNGRFIFVLAIAVIIISCSRAYDPAIERGAEYQFRQGYPEVRMTALGYLDEEGEGMISITADITDGALIFREINGEKVAEIDIEIRISGMENSSYSDTYTTSMTIRSNHKSFIRSPEVVQFRREKEVPPGKYEVTFSVTDKSSDRTTRRSAKSFIPDPDAQTVSLAALQLLGVNPDRQREGYVPVTTYHASSAKDSLRFVTQVTSTESEIPLTIESRLIRFNADSTPSRPMSFPNYSVSSIQYRGIDYRSFEVVDQTRRELEQPGSVMIEFRHKQPGRGNYRFEVRAEGSGTDEEEFRARDFSVKSENFPHIRSPRELAAPLVYLMGSREYEEIMSIDDPDSLKKAVDYFWLSNVGSIDGARQVIFHYYERVEQANKQFTNFKEGWKTDQGMIYILFGPPWYVTTRLNHMQWSYSYDRENPNYNFNFQRPRMPNEHFPFNHYLLQRSPGYFTIQYQQVQGWRTGQIVLAAM